MPRRRGWSKDLTVHKFGGAALADARAMKHAIALVRGTPGLGVVVVSALSGVTDALFEAAGAVGRKPENRIGEIAKLLARRHRRCLAGVVPAGPVRDALRDEI